MIKVSKKKYIKILLLQLNMKVESYGNNTKDKHTSKSARETCMEQPTPI